MSIQVAQGRSGRNNMNPKLDESEKVSELSTVTSKEEVYWKSTCKQCAYRGNRLLEQDWIALRSGSNDLDQEVKIMEIARFPERCTECDTKSRRYSRMTASMRKIVEIRDCLIANRSRTFYEPKLLTVGNNENLDKKEFYARYLKFRNECPWLIGGTYVHEQGKENGMWHSHGVMIAPFIQRCDNPAEHPDVPFIKYENYERIETDELVPCSCKLQRWSNNAAKKWGLGNVHYQAANLSASGFRDAHIANYIAKYMCKDGGRKQSFGALYNCEKEELEMPDGSIKKIWIQPNVQKYRSKIYDWMKTEGKIWR